MSVLTVDDARALIQCALDDARLQAVINREEAALIKRLGNPYTDASTPIVETQPGGGTSLFLRRAITSVTSIVERVNISDTTPTTLTATDYVAWPAEGTLERLPRGARWGDYIVVTYVPDDDRAQWKSALVELVRLTVERTALQSESIAGEYSYTAADWDVKRNGVLRTLGFFNV